MPFADILGHARQLESLRRSLANGRVHHAYLFVGPEGVGKRTIAEGLARGLHCQELPFDFCNQCSSCLSIRAGSHPDVCVVEPQAGKREISIRQIRELTEKIFLRSFSGRTKMALIDPAEVMNYHAQNALLKTLEEPPGDSTLVLIAKSTGALLPTLLSRCLRVSFGYLPVEEAGGFLELRKGLDSAKSRLVAALTMGSIGQAFAWDETEFIDERREWIAVCRSLPEQNYHRALGYAEDLAGDKEKCSRVLHWIEGWLRDVLALQATGTNSLVRNLDLVEYLNRQATTSSTKQTLEALCKLTGVSQALQKNYNRRMVLENFFVGLCARSACQRDPRRHF